MRVLLFGVYIRALVFGNSQIKVLICIVPERSSTWSASSTPMIALRCIAPRDARRTAVGRHWGGSEWVGARRSRQAGWTPIWRFPQVGSLLWVSL